MVMPSNVVERINTRTEDDVRKVKNGTKIRVPTELGVDFGTIMFHEPSPYSKDVYLIRWFDGTQTLFEVKKENLVKDEETTKKKTN
jgi:hypothetical protein